MDLEGTMLKIRGWDNHSVTNLNRHIVGKNSFKIVYKNVVILKRFEQFENIIMTLGSNVFSRSFFSAAIGWRLH